MARLKTPADGRVVMNEKLIVHEAFRSILEAAFSESDQMD